MTFIDVDIRYRMERLRKLYSVILTFIFTVYVVVGDLSPNFQGQTFKMLISRKRE